MSFAKTAPGGQPLRGLRRLTLALLKFLTSFQEAYLISAGEVDKTKPNRQEEPVVPMTSDRKQFLNLRREAGLIFAFSVFGLVSIACRSVYFVLSGQAHQLSISDQIVLLVGLGTFTAGTIFSCALTAIVSKHSTKL